MCAEAGYHMPRYHGRLLRDSVKGPKNFHIKFWRFGRQGQGSTWIAKLGPHRALERVVSSTGAVFDDVRSGEPRSTARGRGREAEGLRSNFGMGRGDGP